MCGKQQSGEYWPFFEESKSLKEKDNFLIVYVIRISYLIEGISLIANCRGVYGKEGLE